MLPGGGRSPEAWMTSSEEHANSPDGFRFEVFPPDVVETYLGPMARSDAESRGIPFRPGSGRSDELQGAMGVEFLAGIQSDASTTARWALDIADQMGVPVSATYNKPSAFASDLARANRDRERAVAPLDAIDRGFAFPASNMAASAFARTIESHVSNGSPGRLPVLAHSEGAVNVANALHEVRLRSGGRSVDLRGLGIVLMGAPVPHDAPILQWARSNGATVSSIVHARDPVTWPGDGSPGRPSIASHSLGKYLPRVESHLFDESRVVRIGGDGRTP